MSMSIKASPDGTYGEILVNGAVVAKLPVTGNAVIPGLVGTVSQSGGVPTGAVVERGINANGEYVRFADGTQICYHLLISSSAGPVVWNFPVVFASPAVRFAFTPQDSNVVVVTSEGTPLATSIALSVFNHLNARVNAINLRGMAIGRWF